MEAFPSECLPKHVTVWLSTLLDFAHCPVNPLLETLAHWFTPKWLQLFADGNKQMKPMRGKARGGTELSAMPR